MRARLTKLSIGLLLLVCSALLGRLTAPESIPNSVGEVCARNCWEIPRGQTLGEYVAWETETIRGKAEKLIVRWEGDAIRVDCDRARVLCDDEGR